MDWNLCPLATRIVSSPEKGNAPHCAALFSESERRNVETQLHHAQRLQSLGAYAGSIAHDFNSLLTGILGNACLASDYVSEGTPMHQCLTEIEHLSLRAAELVNQILVFASNKPSEKSEVSLNDLVKDTANLCRTAVGKDINILFDLEETEQTVLADPVQIRQVLLNLVTNAAEALPYRSGTIQVRTGLKIVDPMNEDRDSKLCAGTYVYLEVDDDGCGMEEWVKNRIFEPYFTTKPRGCGFGMATVWNIVESHQGFVHLTSHPGCGTRCTVYFPTVMAPTCPCGQQW